MPDSVLLCDFSIGAAVRMALARPGVRPQPATAYACPDRDAFTTAVRTFLAANGSPSLMGAAISSRGWEKGGVIQLPQAGMTVSREDMRELLSVMRVNLVNNFVARALAIPRLHGDEVEKICGETAMDEQVIAVLGPHHGLGLAALAPDGAGNWSAIPCEGGHSDLPAETEREWQVYQVLKRRHGHVARENVISLDGIVELWRALGEIDGKDGRPATPQEIVALAASGDARASEAVTMCTGWLAAMASDVGLIMGARGGIYLTGDLMDLLDGQFDRDAFCTRYLAKGRLSGYVREIPVYRTLVRDLEIIGLATLFD